MVKKSGVERRGGASRRKLHTRLYCTLAYNARYVPKVVCSGLGDEGSVSGARNLQRDPETQCR